MPSSFPSPSVSPSSAHLQAVQFIGVRLCAAPTFSHTRSHTHNYSPTPADRRQWSRAFQREMLARGLASVRWCGWVCVTPLHPGETRHDTLCALDWLIGQMAAGRLELMPGSHLSPADIELIHQRLQARIERAQRLHGASAALLSMPSHTPQEC